MKKKDILELKKRLKKEDCTFTKMCGCYVNGEKNIILKFKETFLNLEDDEFFKYLEIAKKTLSGTIGNNLIELNFTPDDDNLSNKQLFLMELKKSGLKDDSILEDFYRSIIDSYEYTGNFLIILFHDAYDVMTKTTDNAKLDESEEVYEYILCAICPVSLSKPGLGYIEDENRIGARDRDWVVGPPDLGFTFPAFIDRSTDINSVIYYTKNSKDSHPELMEDALGCTSKETATEQKEKFHNIISNAIGADDEKSNYLFMDIQETLNNIMDNHTTVNGNEAEPMLLNNDNIQDILIESGISEEITEKIEKSYIDEFGDTPPVVENLIDKKVLVANEQRKKEERLKKKVQVLEERLEQVKSNNKLDSEKESALSSQDETISDLASEVKSEAIEDESTNANLDENLLSEEVTIDETISDDNDTNYDIVLHVKPKKVEQIKTQIIDGQKCIIIPIDDNEQANVNGINTLA